MDDLQFDELIKRLTAGLTRRGAVKSGLAGLAAAVGGASALDAADAKKKKRKGKKGSAQKDKGKGKQRKQKGRVAAQADCVGDSKVLICHKAGQSGNYTDNCVASPAVACAQGHGLHEGDCVCGPTIECLITSIPSCESLGIPCRTENQCCGQAQCTPPTTQPPTTQPPTTQPPTTSPPTTQPPTTSPPTTHPPTTQPPTTSPPTTSQVCGGECEDNTICRTRGGSACVCLFDAPGAAAKRGRDGSPKKGVCGRCLGNGTPTRRPSQCCDGYCEQTGRCGPCQCSCHLKKCGESDGCGGICGWCPEHELCVVEHNGIVHCRKSPVCAPDGDRGICCSGHRDKNGVCCPASQPGATAIIVDVDVFNTITVTTPPTTVITTITVPPPTTPVTPVGGGGKRRRRRRRRRGGRRRGRR